MTIKAKCPKAKVWRKQAVDFAENLANEQCAMMPNTLWVGDITSSTTHRRKPPSDVIFHSDYGSQYSSQAFRNVLTEAKMVHSQSRAGKCTDNAVTERFFRSLKSEKLNGYRFKTRE